MGWQPVGTSTPAWVKKSVRSARSQVGCSLPRAKLRIGSTVFFSASDVGVLTLNGINRGTYSCGCATACGSENA